MAQKRPSDILAVIPDTKRTRHELATFTNKDKALMEVVKYTNSRHNLNFFLYILEMDFK